MSGIVNPSTTKSTVGWIDVYSYLSAAQRASVSAWTGTDVTAAVTAAIAALPSTGGVLYFRPGRWVTSGGFTLAYPTVVVGTGRSAPTASIPTIGISQIECSAGAATLFTVSAKVARFESIALVDTAASRTAGSAILVDNSGATYNQTVDYDNVFCYGFYDAIDIRVGTDWSMHSCDVAMSVRYGMHVQNLFNNDSGDWAIANTNIWPAASATAGIFYESSGGGKISNTKFTAGSVSGGSSFANGILATLSGSGQLFVSNCGIEGCSAECIKITAGWPYMIFNGNYFNTTHPTGPVMSLASVSQSIVSNNLMLGTTGGAIALTNCNTLSIIGNEIAGFTQPITSGSTGYASSIINLNTIGGVFERGVLTADRPLKFHQTLNNAAVQFTGYQFSYTPTAAAAGTIFFDIRDDSSNSGVFLTKDGDGGTALECDFVFRIGGTSKLAYVNSPSFYCSTVSGAGVQFILNSAGSDYGVIFSPSGDTWALGSSADTTTIDKTAIRWTTPGSVIIGPTSALATNATDGFLYPPSSAGAPTGTPTAYTGKVALEYDTTNDAACFYNGQWNALPMSGAVNTAPTGNVNVPASYSLVVVGSYTLAAAKTLTLGAGATMRILN